MSQKGKGRKFFQQMQPTFAIDLPTMSTTTKLEFLDHSDPSKDIVVRKKAREWVNKNKEISKQNREKLSLSPAASTTWTVKDDDETQKELQMRRNSVQSVVLPSPLKLLGMDTLDPFNQLPNIGRRYDHIIYFFLTSCPEEIPCSDDKYSDKSKFSLVSFNNENTILGNMSKHKSSFILWLYATVIMREGMSGPLDSEELQWYYSCALKGLQAALKKAAETGVYPDYLVNCLACITATASYSGIFSTAELHRNALLRVLTLRGNGDVSKGLQSAPPWSIKAVQWCEVMVAMQLVEPPRIPYLATVPATFAPMYVTLETARCTKIALSNLPPLSQPMHNIISHLFFFGIAFAQPPIPVKIDDYIKLPLYDTECTILEVLSAQKEIAHSFTEVEVLLAETFQIYFWVGPRTLPPQTRLCELLIPRLMRALLPLLLETVPDITYEIMPATAALATEQTRSMLASIAGCTPSLIHERSTETNNAITWSLMIGTVVSSVLGRPEQLWFRDHLGLHLRALALDMNEGVFQDFLDLFPSTEVFAWLDLRVLFAQFKVATP
ncbi:hypothetical protein BKA66DRAFT_511484 [Pyrenochaeta sp. MPI-SDFR-AT-0127]|nr:hypothetical protein BKA66DRAFT_511484 [Pyrenochaeta sp. MPI-SDFR-AT-0127]